MLPLAATQPNLTALERQLQQSIQQAQQAAEQSTQQTGALATAVLIFAILYLIAGMIASWQNLNENRGIDRLTWLFAIWLPFGFVIFWILNEETRTIDNHQSSTAQGKGWRI